jgi:hypothetical protein
MLTRDRDIGGVYMLGQGQDSFHQPIGALEDIGYDEGIEFDEADDIGGFGKKLRKKLKKVVKKAAAPTKKVAKKIGKAAKKALPYASTMLAGFASGGFGGAFGGLLGSMGSKGGTTPGIVPDDYGALPGSEENSYGYGTGPTPMSSGRAAGFDSGGGYGGEMEAPAQSGFGDLKWVLGLGAVAAFVLLRRK